MTHPQVWPSVTV